MSVRNLKLLIAYDGQPFYGWQVQPDRPTVQQHIEEAILAITQEHSRLAGAGRTDTGVHALGQVASFRTPSKIPCERMRPAIQSKLPEEIAIRDVTEVPYDFHAGHHAKWKHYRYLIFNSRIARPHLRHYVTRIAEDLNADIMNEAAQYLVGKHDFRSFESNYPNKATSVRTVKYCRVSRSHHWEMWNSKAEFQSTDSQNAPFVYLDIVADGFLYNMVRTITGTLLKIGMGSWVPDEARRVLEAMDRKQAGPTAPANGLYLMHVEYEREFNAELIQC
ncbi:tRNA pseudouridine(38-40) synthase TruA [Rubinisphaera italica]|uniref:tRNA pseudouridine synthase A n=1 Tax=Rubinisphaera italica TaxID=2527969 RepID=A0A5C5XLB9_9PLAN|nr:tRNA pseudouridine(38-40) synthase TruA [Rubinisphaera italica]TWT63654.1 tRNA pseudouridine synthase A [Rubinisphaera italica]